MQSSGSVLPKERMKAEQTFAQHGMEPVFNHPTAFSGGFFSILNFFPSACVKERIGV